MLSTEMKEKRCFVFSSIFSFKYLSTPESQTLLPDVVRFICGVIHPPNEILGSEVIPRWAILGWLYTTCQVS